MPMLDILENLSDFFSYFKDHFDELILACRTKSERDQLQKAYQDLNVAYEQVLSAKVVSQQESSYLHEDPSTRELLKGLNSVRRRIEHGPPNLIDVEALSHDLVFITHTILPREFSMIEPKTTVMPRPGDAGGVRSKAPTKKGKTKEPKKKPIIVETTTRHLDKAAGGMGDLMEIGGKDISIDTSAELRLKDTKASDIDIGISQKALPKRRVVNTGFAQRTYPDEGMDREVPLKTGSRYYFWLEIGEPLKEAIDESLKDIPFVPTKARLTVAVFGFRDGFKITPGADIGELQVQEDGTVQVVKQPLSKPPSESCYLEQRLFFPVRAPAREGIFRMRCNIYCGQILLQSREIHAHVMVSPRKFSDGRRALRSVLDYTLSQKPNQVLLAQLDEHRLSLMINNNGNGTNSLHIYGSKNGLNIKRDDIRFAATDLQQLIEAGRGCLRIASWDSKDGKEEWKAGMPFKYQDRNRDLPRLSKDLISMAQWGYSFYTKFKIDTHFEKVLFEPSLIQIAMKDSPSQVLPAGLIYDYPLDVGAGNLTICPSFKDAFNSGASLENHECFRGNCPTRNEEKRVCPSGFWGFRHFIGMPLSVEKKSDEEDMKNTDKSDVSAQILFTHDLNMVAGIATNLNLLNLHETELGKLKRLEPNLVCTYAVTRDKVFSLLQSSPHLVYFYCHGALLRGALPYLQVGVQDMIFPANFSNIKWAEPRPLVFMNGCQTVDPLGALNFIEPLVQLSKCAGVIGTEITIYEEMATVFAEEFFRRFIGGEAVGMAIRNARLKLLEEGNPLGLVYIPYAIAGLKLVKQTADKILTTSSSGG